VVNGDKRGLTVTISDIDY